MVIFLEIVGLDKDKIKKISEFKEEDSWVLDYRLKSFELFQKLGDANFGPKADIDFDKVIYYKTREDTIKNNWNDISCSIRDELNSVGVLESEKHLDRTIAYIKAKGKKAAVALNPATPVHLLKNIIAELDMVLIMSVNPGFGGQKFIEYTIDKVKEVKEMSIKYNKNLMIQVDGGIDSSNVQKVIDAGANVIVAGSAVFKNGAIEENIKALRGI